MPGLAGPEVLANAPGVETAVQVAGVAETQARWSLKLVELVNWTNCPMTVKVPAVASNAST